MTTAKNKAILWLQLKLTDCESPYWSKVYEQALEYATAPNSKRKEGVYYLQNLISDAKKFVGRSKAKMSYVSLDFTDCEFLDHKITQEFDFFVTDLEDEILYSSSQIHPKCQEVFELLKIGYTTNEIAEELQLSNSYIRRLVSQVKEVTMSVCLN